MRRLDCGHSFHMACIDTWLDEQPICPLCRAPIAERRAEGEDDNQDTTTAGPVASPAASPTGPAASPTGPAASPTGPAASPTGPAASPTIPTPLPEVSNSIEHLLSPNNNNLDNTLVSTLMNTIMPLATTVLSNRGGSSHMATVSVPPHRATMHTSQTTTRGGTGRTEGTASTPSGSASSTRSSSTVSEGTRSESTRSEGTSTENAGENAEGTEGTGVTEVLLR